MGTLELKQQSADFLAVIISAGGVATAFVASLILHPVIFRPGASRFSVMRAGPGVGVILILLTSLVTRRHCRSLVKTQSQSAETLLDALSGLWAAGLVACGTLLADMLRSVFGR